MDDSRETFGPRAFVTGYPIRHSRSPLIHNYWRAQFKLGGSYKPVPVEPEKFPDFLVALRNGRNGFVGGNVTIPHKEMAFKLADRPDGLARELGAANTLWRQDGLIHATNTDGFGFVSNLEASSPGWVRAGRAVIFGAGGASRAVIQAVRDCGIGEIHVVNRTVERAQELADRFGPRVHAHRDVALQEVMQGAGLFINTTSLGMDGTAVPEIDFRAMLPEAIVTDIVYFPLQTPILKQARRQGFRTVDGLGMLLHQAVPGFEKWFGQKPVVDEALRALVIADMEEHG